jgi:signal transduction histidine kinase
LGAGYSCHARSFRDEWKRPVSFHAEEIQVTASKANRIASSIRDAELLKESWANARDVSLLYHVAKVINQSLDLRTLLSGVMRELRKLFKFEIGRIGLLEENGKELAILADEGRLRKTIPPGKDIMKKVLEGGHPVIFEDIPNNPLYKEWSVNKIALKEGLRTAFYLPIKSKRKKLGVIGILGKRAHRFSRSEIRLIFSVADHLGIAVENAQLYDAVRRAHGQLRGLAHRMQSAREEERTKLAREVHDELGQQLSALKMQLAMADVIKGKETSKPIFDLIDQMIETVRNIAARLRPAVLDDLGLTEAIEWQAQDFQRRTGIQCKVTSRVEENSLPPGVAVSVFRIFQETLSNVVRHAGADNVKVEWKKDSGDLLLRVRDNGRGIKRRALTDRSCFGILGMKERALVCGGNLDISGISGKGTTVSLRIPASWSESGVC